MDKTELLKCPFCGGEAEYKTGNHYISMCHYIRCKNCHLQTGAVDEGKYLQFGGKKDVVFTAETAKQYVIDVWNRRTLSPDINEPCWCKNCIHVTNEDGLNYLCINKDSIHYDEWVQPECTCEECVRRTPSPDNKALTVEELRERKKPVWCDISDCEWIPAGGYYCLCDGGFIIAPSGQRFSADECLKNGWVLLDRPPEKGE